MRLKKISRPLIALVIIAFISVPGYSLIAWSAENTVPVRLPEDVRADNPLKLLKGFDVVPGATVLVGGAYVIALFENTESGLYALVSFSANCDTQGCTIKDLLTYALFGRAETDPQFVRA